MKEEQTLTLPPDLPEENTETVEPSGLPTASPTTLLTPNPNQTIVGAIRWDAWVGDFDGSGNPDQPGLVVERTLSPNHWHYRLPFFAVVLDGPLTPAPSPTGRGGNVPDGGDALATDASPGGGRSQVMVRGATQQIIDQEIVYASQAGLDYWAFVYYPEGNGLDLARKLYLSSEHRDAIKFSLIFDAPRHFEDVSARELFVRYFQMTNYQKVLNGRPLVFIFGNRGLSLEGVQKLRQDTIEAGLPTPYIVYMGWSSAEARANIELYGLDAGSAYATLGSNGQPFMKMARYGQVLWDQYHKAGIQVVPWVTTGWDPRPRIENPTPWVTYPENQWAQTAKPGEIALHLQEALAWIETNPDAALANTVIVYAWNEFDEGGWLCPTLEEGAARLDAIQKLLVGE